MERHTLYPPIIPNQSGHMARDNGHEVYWEECGNPNGQPVVFLHGGPGAGCSAGHRRFFDPEHYRIVLMDQRGCGRSTPLASLDNNTTQALIGDLEALRRALEIDQWLLFGGSWGSTLALAYAEAHPENVTGLILRGIFLGTAGEIRWFVEDMGRFFPEAFATFRDHLPETDRAAPLAAYYRRLCDPDPAVHRPAADIWAKFEAQCSTLLPNDDVVGQLDHPDTALSLARLEAHYFSHGMFLDEGQLLRDIGRIADKPCVIVQGRYDVICPPNAAHALNQSWPGSELVMIDDAGHSATEPGISRTLVAACERFKRL